LLANWLAGFLSARGPRPAAPALTSSSLADRLRAHLDASGHLKVGGVLAVIVADDGPTPDDLAGVLRDQLRNSDILGHVAGGAGALLPHLPGSSAATLVERLARLARTRFGPRVQVGATALTPSSESPSAAIERAVANARRAGTS
jgi:hypothetical protein